jgi:proteasome accessory factor B
MGSWSVTVKGEASNRPRPADQKLQRWIDLLAALLRNHFGVTFEQLRAEVPAYGSTAKPESLARMFERDKDELRALGMPITTTTQTDDEPQRYRVDRRELYLPYLMMATGAPQRMPPMREGYRLPTVAFEPDELRALVQGAREVSKIDDAGMASDAASALRKLAYDLDVPVDSVMQETQDVVVTPREPATAAGIRILGDALLRLKRVTFTYRSMSSDKTAPRTVEPYGLFFASGHWYLAGRDTAKEELRNYRVSRIEDLAVNAAKQQSEDYEIPENFRLSEHARSRGPWELGDGDAEQMVVEFRGESGVTQAALQLGAPSTLGERHRSFEVRRVDSFVRWLLSFAGEVVPVSPPRLVQEYAATARATLSVYETAR